MSDEIVGHKTFRNGDGSFRHEPLRRSEADAIMESVHKADEKRKADYPDERAAINAIFQAYERLRELGWREAMYMPPDGSVHQALEMGSTGIHRCYCTYRKQGDQLSGRWYWTPDDGICPMSPYLFKKIEAKP